jgi:hypothetical protein
MSEQTAQVLMTLITTVGTIVSLYFARSAKRHADRATSGPPREMAKPGEPPSVPPTRITGRHDFGSILDKIDDERDD